MNIAQYLSRIRKKYYSIRHRPNQQIPDPNTRTESNLGDLFNIKDGPVKKQLPEKLVQEDSDLRQSLFRKVRIFKKRKKNESNYRT